MVDESSRNVISRLTQAVADRYHIERELGAGGMATVYLAQDIKHDRDVAIKVLHPDLGAALGSGRFLAEIRTTAKLQHPHILSLLDSGEADGLLYYVMPFVTGQTLRGRLDQDRQLPINDAIRIAIEVADALGAAHALNIIHRDIKPENILLQGGHALVADFGIALAVQSAAGSRMTQTGLSLGTPQYMSPEQAMGERTIDARSDIYSLGAVTYEMLAGEPPFTGPNVQAIVAKVLSERPTPLAMVRDTVPAHVEDTVLIALAKLPADRFATAQEFATALTNESHSTTMRSLQRDPHRPKSRARWRDPVVVGLGAMVTLLIGALSFLTVRVPSRNHEPVTRVAIAFPDGQELLPQWRGFNVALSKDGTRIAYVGPGPTRNTTQLWIRRLDGLDATPVPNTIGASTVRWSPDGRSLLISSATTGNEGSFVSLDRGQLTDVPGSYDGDIGTSGRVYSLGHIGAGTRLEAASPAITRQMPGGAKDSIALKGKLHPLNLTVLPDESAVLVSVPRDSAGVYAEARIVAVSLITGRQMVIGPGVYAKYLPSGHLLFVSASGEAFVAPFDSRTFRITGAATPIARVAFSTNSGKLYPQITVSDNGSLVYVSGEMQRQRLTWLDANGRVTARLASEGNFWGIALSPDGSLVALATRQDDRIRGARVRGTGDVFVENLRTGARTQLTSDYFNVRPSWSADGAFVLYTRIGGPLEQALIERRGDASSPERPVVSAKSFGNSIGDGRWLPDHRTVIVRTYETGKARSRDMYYVNTGGSDGTAHPVATTSADETAPAPSPDGALFAYNSDDTGTTEVYVQPFPSGTGRVQVSHGGGSAPRWSPDGHLYYWDQHDRLIAVTIQSRPSLAITNVREIGGDIVPAVAAGGATISYDVAADGRVILAEPVAGSFRLVLVRNWMAGLR